MNRTPLLLILIFMVTLAVRIHRVGSFAVFPESDVYYYLNSYHAVLHNGAVTGLHPGFTSLLGSAGVLSDVAMIPLYRYFGPLLGALTVLVVYACAARVVGEQAGLLAAFLWGMTPLAVVRGGQTIAETLALPLLVLHVFLVYDAIASLSRRAVLIVPILLALLFIHNLTFTVALLATVVGGMTLCALHRRWVGLGALAAACLLLMALVYYVLPDSLPKFREHYETLYKAIQSYVATRTFGNPTSMGMSVYDLLVPPILLVFTGIVPLIRRQRQIVTYLCAIALALLFMTPAFRVGFNFVPHRFLIYLAIPLSLLAGAGLAALYRAGMQPAVLPKASVVVASCLILVHAATFPFSFEFLIEDADFETLSWGNGRLDGPILSYSRRPDGGYQNKYAALAGETVVFKNSLFATHDVDRALLEVVSASFGMPFVDSDSLGVPTYGVHIPKGTDTKDLAGRDRTLTSLAIARTFWVDPPYVVVCDAAVWEQGVECGKAFRLPVVLYAEEHRGEILDQLRVWGSTVVLLTDSEKLARGFEYYGIASVVVPPVIQHPAHREGELLFYPYDVTPLVDAVERYLYLSREVNNDYKDIGAALDMTRLSKIYCRDATSYYII